MIPNLPQESQKCHLVWLIICLAVQYLIDPNHQYRRKTTGINGFPCFGINLMYFNWLPAFKVLDTNLCLTEIFLSQCCNEISSIEKQSHENFVEFMCLKERNFYTDTITYFLSSGSPFERRVCERVSFFHEVSLFCLVQEPHDNVLSFEACISGQPQHT